MNEFEQFETQLLQRQPARLSEDFVARLRAAEPAPQKRSEAPLRRRIAVPDWPGVWRWLLPATAVVVAGLVVWRLVLAPPGNSSKDGAVADAAPLKADDVQVREQLVSSFDAVAKLPTGEPVRFRCQKWVDQVVLRDKKRGVVIEQRTPRLEVVPVGFETY